MSKTHLIHFSAKMYSKKIATPPIQRLYTSYSKTLRSVQILRAGAQRRRKFVFKRVAPAKFCIQTCSAAAPAKLFIQTWPAHCAGENLNSKCVFIVRRAAGDHLDLGSGAQAKIVIQTGRRAAMA